MQLANRRLPTGHVPTNWDRTRKGLRIEARRYGHRVRSSSLNTYNCKQERKNNSRISASLDLANPQPIHGKTRPIANESEVFARRGMQTLENGMVLLSRAPVRRGELCITRSPYW